LSVLIEGRVFVSVESKKVFNTRKTNVIADIALFRKIVPEKIFEVREESWTRIANRAYFLSRFEQP
jgi:hypothetical protein